MKKLKSLLALVLILPCLFLFSGCSDGMNKFTVDTSGTYTEVDASTFTDFNATAETEITTGYKMYGEFNTIQGSEVSMKMVYSGIFRLDAESEVVEFSMKTKTTENGTTFKMDFYVVNNTIYLNLLGMKYYMAFDPETSGVDSNTTSLTYLEYLTDTYLNEANISTFATVVNEGTENEKTITKYKIELGEEGLTVSNSSQYVIYLVYENNTIKGIQTIFKTAIEDDFYGLIDGEYIINIEATTELPQAPADINNYINLEDIPLE